jgi:outer membrane receptor protein involved in Fe transport
VGYYDTESGDLAQYYNQKGLTNYPSVPSPSRTMRIHEEQLPNVIGGYHRKWSPGHDTLLLAGRFDDDFELTDTAASVPWLRSAVSPFVPGVTNVSVRNAPFTQLDYESELVVYSAELAHIWKTERQTLIAGARYQIGTPDTDSDINRQTPLDPTPVSVISQNEDPNLERFSVYAYENLHLLDELLITAGLSYDNLRFPKNVDAPPISGGNDSEDQLSPKLGAIWSPWDDTHFRGVYTRSLGGVYFDNSVRLEPTQVAGFNQAFRSLIPESVGGLVPGTKFETFGLGWDQSFKTGTYLTVQGELLTSEGARTIGIMTNSDVFVPVADSAGSARETLDYEERSLLIALNQTLGSDWSVGLRYRLTDADMKTSFSGSDPVLGTLDQDVEARLHQVLLHANYNLRCGFFAEGQAIWSGQSNHGYAPSLDDEDFWQFNLYVGYRFKMRHAEARLGLVNITDEDYQLNPLTLYRELPRERMFTASFKFYF